MCREEGLKCCYLFSKIKNKYERQFPYEDIMNQRYNFKQELKKNDNFILFFQENALSLLNILERKNNPEYYRLFSNSEIFDSLVSFS